MILNAPFEIVSMAITLFMVGLGLYLGLGMTAGVNLSTGTNDNRGVPIAFCHSNHFRSSYVWMDDGHEGP